MRLSAIDSQWPGQFAETATLLERYGYHRYWLTEHHSQTQSASPILLTALAAGVTNRIRVGTAGILLHYASPVRIAEDFRLLQLFYGDRMDLGIAAAIVADPVGSALLDGRNSANMPRFADKLADLKALVSPPTGTLGPAIQLGPGFHTPNSEFWMCGGGERLATLAGNLGMRFAFHHYFHQSRQATASGPAIVSQYRSAFSASSSTERPYVAVACYGICADVETDAEHLWHANFGAQETVPDPCFSGTPADCISRLRAIRLAYGADEIVVQSLTPDFHARLRSYQLLADGISK